MGRLQGGLDLRIYNLEEKEFGLFGLKSFRDDKWYIMKPLKDMILSSTLAGPFDRVEDMVEEYNTRREEW